MLHHDDNLTQADNLRFIRGAMQAPMLEKSEEFKLARAWRNKGDEKALHKLIKSYARLVVSVATRFRHYGLPLGDLIQEGHIGLLQAANRFETSRNVRFSTYALWWIRASIQDYVLRNWSVVRTGTTASQKSLFFNLRRLKSRIEGKTPEGMGAAFLSSETRKDIAATLRVSEAEVDFMDQRLTASDYSLNATLNSEDGRSADFQDMLVDDRPSPEENAMMHFDGAVQQKWLKEALTQLDTRERRIIRDRHLRENAATLEDLGEDLHISKERVRQLEARALGKLKVILQERANGKAPEPLSLSAA
jgi:RNA polymerase sigma-32 factor